MLGDGGKIKIGPFHKLVNAMLLFRKLLGDPETDGMAESFEYFGRSGAKVLIKGVHSVLWGKVRGVGK